MCIRSAAEFTWVYRHHRIFLFAPPNWTAIWAKKSRSMCTIFGFADLRGNCSIVCSCRDVRSHVCYGRKHLFSLLWVSLFPVFVYAFIKYDVVLCHSECIAKYQGTLEQIEFFEIYLNLKHILCSTPCDAILDLWNCFWNCVGPDDCHARYILRFVSASNCLFVVLYLYIFDIFEFVIDSFSLSPPRARSRSFFCSHWMFESLTHRKMVSNDTCKFNLIDANEKITTHLKNDSITFIE